MDIFGCLYFLQLPTAYPYLSSPWANRTEQQEGTYCRIRVRIPILKSLG